MQTLQQASEAQFKQLANKRWTGLVDVEFDAEALEVLVPPGLVDVDVDTHTGTHTQHTLPIGTVYISSSDNPTGYDRTRRLRTACETMGLKCLRMKPVMDSGKLDGLVKTFLLGLKIWQANDESDALFVEDDVYFNPDFASELEKGLLDLPAAWQVFHLCPRNQHSSLVSHQPSHAFHMMPEETIAGNPRRSASGRVWLDWPKFAPPTCCENEQGILPGGPVAALIQRDSMALVESTMRQALSNGGNQPIDIVLRNLAMQHVGYHFVAAEPQLCIEEQFM